MVYKAITEDDPRRSLAHWKYLSKRKVNGKWQYVYEVPKNEVEELQQQIAILQEDRSNLEFVLLDTNFRLTCMELKDQGLLD